MEMKLLDMMSAGEELDMYNLASFYHHFSLGTQPCSPMPEFYRAAYRGTVLPETEWVSPTPSTRY